MSGEQLNLQLTFGDSFLEYHAGSIIADPHYALIELVANCWDAGADRVDIEWLRSDGQCLSVQDNGTGMTYEEFTQRWTQLNYNRLKYQGNTVEFPPKSTKRKRVPFGRNGIGRHAMFCFADKYFVETRKNGEFHLIRVERSYKDTPFKLILEDKGSAEGHGTKIYAEAKRNVSELTPSQVSELIGSRFVADPEFNIYVNGNFVSLNEKHEVVGFKSIVIVELKKGGFKITNEEKTQAANYARELRRSGKVGKSTKIICYVLGTYVDPLDEDTSTDGETTIHPRTYNTVLRQAHARTFNLLKK